MEVSAEHIENTNVCIEKVHIRTEDANSRISPKNSIAKGRLWGLIPPNFMGADSPAARQPTPFNANRFSLLIGYFVYSALTASVYFGWPGFSNMLFDSGAYEWLCENEEKVTNSRYMCEKQDSAVQRLFQIAIPSHFLTSAVAGTLIDSVGPKYTALFGQFLNFSSWVLLSFASPSFNVYILAFVLMGAGADTGFLPTLHVSNLFEGNSGFIIALMGAAASSSFAIPTILDAIHSGNDISFEYICRGYAVVLIVAFLYAYFFIPKNAFQPLEKLNGSSLLQDDNQTVPDSFVGRWRASFWSAIGKISSSRKEFFTIKYLAILLFFAFTSLIFNFWMVSGEHLLGKTANNFFGIVNPISFLPTIIYGKMVDSFGIEFVMAVNTVFGFISYVAAILDIIASKYISAIAMVIYVSFFTSQMFCYIQNTFDSIHFGKLVGVCSAFGGLFSLLSILLYDPLTKITFSGNFLWVSSFMMLLLLFNFILVFIMQRLSRHHKEYAEKNFYPAQLSASTDFCADIAKNEKGNGFAVSLSTEDIL